MRDVWIDSYLDQLLTRDGHSSVAGRDQYKLARYFGAVAASSAGIPEHKPCTTRPRSPEAPPTSTVGCSPACSSPRQSPPGPATASTG